ncbi:MAG: hypothetical protein K9G13_01985 [Aquiluna sp.]|nr:hypothetical protein [Aquiluna sp.]MCF8545294.1 hypothetical protein [Aquiluna sp.]
MHKTKTIIRVVASIIIALALVIIGTSIHQSLSNEFPVGLIAAGLLLFSAATNFRSNRVSSWIFTLTFVAGMMLTAQKSNQDAMLPANTLGFTWSYGAIALVLLVSIWPRIRSKA